MICPKCGEVLAEGTTVCTFCSEDLTKQPEAPTPPAAPTVKPENVPRGMLGAVLGAILGGGLIVLLYTLDYVAGLSGFVMAFLALQGYRLLGGRLTRRGVLLSIIPMVIVPLIAYFVALGVMLSRATPEWNFIDSLNVIFSHMGDQEVRGTILSDVLLLYLFTALGAVSTIYNAFHTNQQ